MISMWYNNCNLDSDFTLKLLTQSSEEEDDVGRGVPDRVCHPAAVPVYGHSQLPDFISSISCAVTTPYSIMGAAISWQQCWWANRLIATLKKGWKEEGWYVISTLMCYGCLPYEMALVMLTKLRGVKSREYWSHWVGAFHQYIVFEKGFSTLI